MTRLKTTADARDRHRTHLSLEALRRELTPQERHEWDLLHDADLAAELEQQVARLEAEVERLDAMGIHTCGYTCQKLPCVQRRRIRELEAALAPQPATEAKPDFAVDANAEIVRRLEGKTK